MKVSAWEEAGHRWSQTVERVRDIHESQWIAGKAMAYPVLLHGVLKMDMTWVTGRIAVGGGIWTADNMVAVARAGVTHIIDMQIEFDDTKLAEPHGIDVLW